MVRVARLATNPIRGLALVPRDEIRLDERGVSENRRFFLVDADGRRYTLSRGGELVRLAASWDEESGRLSVSFPDGATVAGEVELGAPVATEFAGPRRVDGRFVEGPWSVAISAFAGRPLRLVQTAKPGEAFPGGRPVSLVSEASVAELARHAGVAAVDDRRFRMLIGLDGCEAHEEDTWIGRRVRVGGALLAVGGPIDRCAATTRNPVSGEVDLDTLRVIKGYRGLRDGKHADFGVYASVLEPGRVRVGDAVDPG